MLLDECVDRRLATDIQGHDVKTVPDAGWAALKNGELLARAQHEFGAFVTVDRNLPFQQELPRFSIAGFVSLVPTSSSSRETLAVAGRTSLPKRPGLRRAGRLRAAERFTQHGPEHEHPAPLVPRRLAVTCPISLRGCLLRWGRNGKNAPHLPARGRLHQHLVHEEPRFLSLLPGRADRKHDRYIDLRDPVAEQRDP